MSDLSETSVWEAGIRQLDEADPVQGGPGGVSNLQPRQLANRTLYLKNLVEALGTGKLDIASLASQAQAEAGADNTKWMTPLRVAQAIAALATIAMATDTTAGKVELATSAETITGTDTTRATHPAGVKAAITAAVAAVVNSSPTTLDTLNELAAALGNDPNFATSIAALIAGKQDSDATLTALSGLTTAANQIPYSTGADAFAMTTLSAFMRTLLDDADAATARATLGAAAISDINQNIGVGQTWQNVSGSRALATTYTNSTGRPILVSVALGVGAAGQSVTATVSGVTVVSAPSAGFTLPFSFIVPNGGTYSVTATSGFTSWSELR